MSTIPKAPETLDEVAAALAARLGLPHQAEADAEAWAWISRILTASLEGTPNAN